MKKIIIQFNEANFDIINKYVDKYDLSGLKSILNFHTKIITSSENEYSKLEPWIQWYSFYTSKSYKEHKIFHLGDSEKTNLPTFFDEINQNKTIGCFASMNLPFSKRFKIFISDPWSRFKSDKTLSSKFVSSAIEQIINSNNKLKISITSFIGICYLIGLPKNIQDLNFFYLTIISFIKKDRSTLAGYFDYFFMQYSLRRIKNNQLDYSMIFLNGLAHIQHRFLSTCEFINNDLLFNQEINQKDEVYKILKIYDLIFKNIFKECSKNYEIWIITGLTQKIYKKPKLYWRFIDHDSFLKNFLFFPFDVDPLMTRDFKLKCEDNSNFIVILDFLKNAVIVDENGNQLCNAFGYIDIVDTNEVFASLILDIDKDNKFIFWNKKKIRLDKNLEFVAYKNGEHHHQGWAFCNNFYDKKETPIWELGNIVKK